MAGLREEGEESSASQASSQIRRGELAVAFIYFFERSSRWHGEEGGEEIGAGCGSRRRRGPRTPKRIRSRTDGHDLVGSAIERPKTEQYYSLATV